MGAKILAVDTARPGLMRQGSVDLMAKAAGSCMKRAAVDPKQLGLLINVGVYRDRHLVEPAMSSFVQRRMGARGEWNEEGGAFSFDLTNGACGPLTGLMVADGFIRSGRTSHALVVSGDAEPWPGLSRGYDIAPSAAAVLLVPGGPEEGFPVLPPRRPFSQYPIFPLMRARDENGQGRERNATGIPLPKARPRLISMPLVACRPPPFPLDTFLGTSKHPAQPNVGILLNPVLRDHRGVPPPPNRLR
jgi:hypothetical protein